MIGAYLWYQRGTHGSPYQHVFAWYIALLLVIGGINPIYAILYALWLGLGEGPGWKPKLWRNDNSEFGKYAKLKCVVYGLCWGGIGALIVPLSTEISDGLHKRFGWWEYEWNEAVAGGMVEALAILVAIGALV